jgi:uncharacterized protein YciI
MRDGGRDVSRASPYGGAMEFETSTFVFLMRAYPQPSLSDEDRERIQQEHLDYLTRLTDEGPIIVAGPFGDQTDENLRGLCVMAVPMEEALALMSQDPSVRAGVFRCESATWYRFPGRATFRSTPE